MTSVFWMFAKILWKHRLSKVNTPSIFLLQKTFNFYFISYLPGSKKHTPGPRIMQFLWLGKSDINWIHLVRIYSTSANLFTYALSFYVTKTVLVGPKWFWSDQIDLDLTIMICSRPKWNGHDQNELVRSKCDSFW